METLTGSRLTRVTDDPARSFSLPGWAYTDPDILALEKREIFFKTWQYAGSVDALKETGAYITVDLMEQSIIIIRGQDGELKGFHNVCQHRGHQLLLERTGRVGAITCPYHAWTYRLDGSLRNARGAEKTEAFEADRFSLREVRVEIVMNKLIFFNLDNDAAPFAPQIADLIDDIRAEVPDFDELELMPRGEITPDITAFLRPIAANWKVVMDNFLECYHCRPTHPGFSRDVRMDSYTTTAYGLWSKQKGPTRRDNGAEVIFWALFPNITMSTTTNCGPNFRISTFVTPLDATTTVRHLGDNFQVPGVSVEDQRPDWGPLNQEDRDICEYVQKGLASKGYDAGRFIYDADHGETSEEAVHHFHRCVVTSLGI